MKQGKIKQKTKGVNYGKFIFIALFVTEWIENAEKVLEYIKENG
jgi:hypothetical protein